MCNTTENNSWHCKKNEFHPQISQSILFCSPNLLEHLVVSEEGQGVLGAPSARGGGGLTSSWCGGGLTSTRLRLTSGGSLHHGGGRDPGQEILIIIIIIIIIINIIIITSTARSGLL